MIVSFFVCLLTKIGREHRNTENCLNLVACGEVSAFLYIIFFINKKPIF